MRGKHVFTAAPSKQVDATCPKFQNCIHCWRQAILERSKAMQAIKKHKMDTRGKIEFGGLVIKSNLSQYSKDVILGTLIDVVDQLSDNQEVLAD